MSRKYSFEEKTIDGKKYVISSTGDEPVRVRADWVEDDDNEGKWEKIIEQVVQPETIDSIELNSGDGGIDRNEAINALAGATVDGETIVTSKKQADVLVEYLEKEDIIGIEGNQLILFRDPDNDSLDGKDLMNWAALMNAVIERINEHTDRVENAQERFEETIEELETDQSNSNERLSKTAQRLKNLGEGQGIPKPDTLSDEERKKYNQLKSHYLYLKNIEEAKEQNLFENINSGIDQMSMAVERLEAAREIYHDFYNDTRTAAIKKSVFPEEALSFVENAGSLINDLAGNEEVNSEDVSHSDLEQMVEGELGETVQDQAETTTQVADSASKAAGMETTTN